MTTKHSFQILQTGSRYVGRRCPSTRTELRPGEQVVVCHKNDEVFSWDALPVLDGRCPFCEQQIAFEEILGPSRTTYEKTAGPTKEKADKTKAKPGYVPVQHRTGLPLVLVALGILALMGICGIGGVIGYRQFFAQSTPVPTAQLAARSTEIPTALEPTTASSAVEILDSTNTPQPTSTPRPTPTDEPSPTPMLSPTPCSIAVAPRFTAAWNQYADSLGCPINQAHTHEAASQDFEHGFLLWRVSPDQVYVMYDDGRLGFYPMSVYPESVRQNPPGGDPNIQPPAGFQQPVRGFGLIWRDNVQVRDGLGWAVEGEARADWYYGFEAQDFVGGTILHECRMGVRVLLSSGTWFKISGGESCN